MKRLSDWEKKQLGVIIQYYRNNLFRSNIRNKDDYKQVNFCRGICSQAQLSRLEQGDVLKNQEVYAALLEKLNLKYEKVSSNDYIIFESYFESILSFHNDDNFIINYNEYLYIVNKYHNTFKNNIVYTHYNYALEFILALLNDDIDEASCFLEDVENTLDILKPKLLVITLHYLGLYYHLIKDYNQASKYYRLTLEHMNLERINNPVIFMDFAYNEIKKGKYLIALNYLHQGLTVINSNNYVMLTKVYQYYSLIYLYNKYYEEAIVALNDAIEYSIHARKKTLTKICYELMAISLYFNGNTFSALKYLEKSREILWTEELELIKFIITKGEINNEVILQNNLYKLIKEFLLSDNKDLFYEKHLEKDIPNLPDSLQILLKQLIYDVYKEAKKYKKVLEILEK